MIAFWPKQKYNASSCGLWRGMTEVHCHLLPGVDDGVGTALEALSLLRYMEEEVGVKNVWMTPHTMMDFNNVPSGLLLDKFNDFSADYQGNLQLSIASEYMLDATFDTRISQGDVLPLGKWVNQKLLLVETSDMMPQGYLDTMLENIARSGYIPVIAHPERYLYMNERKYPELIERGCLLQLNVPSLYGYYGDKIKKRAEKLMDEGMYQFAGFDIHRYESYAKVIQGLKLTRKRLERLEEILDNNNVIK